MRTDFAVGEDADLILVADANQQGVIATQASAIKAAERDEAFVLPLPEDGGVSARLVIGALNDDEDSRWVARVTRNVAIPTGQLVVDGGGYFGRSPNPTVKQAVDYAVFDIPPGTHKLTCLVYITSDIATDLFRRRKVSYLKWFQETFPGSAIPAWLVEAAEARDHDAEEALLESIDHGELEVDEEDDSFIDVILHLEPNSVCREPTKLLARGKLSWERRLPKQFPLPLVGNGVRRSGDSRWTTRTIVDAFVDQTFDSVRESFTRSLRPQISDFLAAKHASIREVMDVPSRRVFGSSLAKRDDWLDKIGHPNAQIDATAIQQHSFSGSVVLVLVDNSHRGQLVSVDFHLAFVKAESGLKVAGIQLGWNAPRRQTRRRTNTFKGPPCPHCGEPLASDKAKQCIGWGANWH
ncbi:MAG: hypothetical protein AAGA03_10255 [Planctomycetota bacterium]